MQRKLSGYDSLKDELDVDAAVEGPIVSVGANRCVRKRCLVV